MQYGDLTWSSVRGKGSRRGQGGSGGSGGGSGGSHGSHLDGTEDALHLQVEAAAHGGPSGYEVNERPDISAEVHLTTVSPALSALNNALGATAAEVTAPEPGPAEEAIALYYQREEKGSSLREHRDEEQEAGERPPPRKRGRVRYGDQLRGRRRKRPRQQEHDAEDEPRRKHEDADDEDHREDRRQRDDEEDDDETARSSAEPHGRPRDGGDNPIGVVRADEAAEIGDGPRAPDEQELAHQTNKLLEELTESRAVRKRLRKRPRIMTETGHILRGLEVKETVQADKWR